MEPVFSMEEILGPFWDLPSPPPPEQQPLVIGTSSVVIDGVVTHGGNGEGSNMMDQIQNTTEDPFERLLEEELLTDTTPVANSSCPALNVDPVVEVDQGAMAPEAVSAVGDPMEYNAILKRNVEEDLMAFKMWRASTSGVNSEGSNNENGGDLHVRLTTSSSSRDPSPSDEDMDGEVEILGFKMPTEERVRKRKESNRESARRSRYRKAAHLKDLEDQVDKLKAENSCLSRRLAALNQKYNHATVDNRVLKADMETLRAKVKMGEDSLKRIIEMTSLTSIPIPELPSSSDVPVHIQDNIVNYFTTTPAGDALADHSFMPMPDPLPLQLQAEEPTINGALNARDEPNRYALRGREPTINAAYPGDNGSHDADLLRINSPGI
nr:Opaque-2-related protein - sorghum [Sorghum bicolor]